MSNWGLKYYYPLCGFDCGQVLNKRHVRKHGLVKLTDLDLRNKVPKIQGPGVGLAISPLLSLFLSFFGGGFFFARLAGACL